MQLNESKIINFRQYEKTDEDIYEDDERSYIACEIMDFAHSHPKFDISFSESIYEALIYKGSITSAQYNGLVNIYYAFKIDEYSNMKNQRTTNE